MYTDEEILYHAFKISQTRDDQLMHAGKSKKQITTDRMNRNQNTYGNAKANAYKSSYNQSQYAKKYADPNDPWAKENSWKEERRNTRMSPKERNKTVYEDEENKDLIVGPHLKVGPDAEEAYFEYLLQHEINNIPSGIDRILSERASTDPNFIDKLYRWAGHGAIFRDDKQKEAEANMVYAYLAKMESNINNAIGKRFNRIWTDKKTGKLTDQSDTQLSNHGKQTVRQALKDKYGFR